MRKLISVLSILVALAGGYVLAQDATLGAPVPRASESKLTVRDFCATQGAVTIEVSVQDVSGNEIRVQGYTIPDAAHAGATVAGFFTALDTVRASPAPETGGVLRRANYRMLGYLSDQGYLPGTTLNP